MLGTYAAGIYPSPVYRPYPISDLSSCHVHLVSINFQTLIAGDSPE